MLLLLLLLLLLLQLLEGTWAGHLLLRLAGARLPQQLTLVQQWGEAPGQPQETRRWVWSPASLVWEGPALPGELAPPGALQQASAPPRQPGAGQVEPAAPLLPLPACPLRAGVLQPLAQQVLWLEVPALMLPPLPQQQL